VLYERARAALVEHVRVTIPALPPSEVARQRAALEAAIRKVESDSLRQIDPLVELARLIGATHLIAPPSITSSQSNPPRAELGALNSHKRH
jgi:hypothetical protein